MSLCANPESEEYFMGCRRLWSEGELEGLTATQKLRRRHSPFDGTSHRVLKRHPGASASTGLLEVPLTKGTLLSPPSLVDSSSQ